MSGNTIVVNELGSVEIVHKVVESSRAHYAKQYRPTDKIEQLKVDNQTKKQKTIKRNTNQLSKKPDESVSEAVALNWELDISKWNI